MLVEIKRKTFNSLNDIDLGWACIEPTIQKVRGRDLNIKSQVYNQLTHGQQSLLMFWVLYGHSRNGIIQFYNEMDYLLTEIGIWPELRKSMLYFGNNDMLELLKEIENMYYILQRNQLENSKMEIISTNNDPELLLAVDQLDKKFHKIIQSLFKKIGKFIRENPNEFVYLVD